MTRRFLFFLFLFISVSCGPQKSELRKETFLPEESGKVSVQSILHLEGTVVAGPSEIIACAGEKEITLYRNMEKEVFLSFRKPVGRLQWGADGEHLYFIEYDNFIAPFHWMNAGTLKRYSLLTEEIQVLSHDGNVSFYTLSDELLYISLGSLYRCKVNKGGSDCEKIVNGFCVAAYPLGSRYALYRRTEREIIAVADKKGKIVAELDKGPVRNRLLPAYALSAEGEEIVLDVRGRRERYRLRGKTLEPVSDGLPNRPLPAQIITAGSMRIRWELEEEQITLFAVTGEEDIYLTHAPGKRPLDFQMWGEYVFLRWSDGALLIRLASAL
ncbi:MAG TPA: hypothetical protein ENN72_02675 [Firmicutes bacterium]|nr:hypothetical protein [Bacillota bacterium]